MKNILVTGGAGYIGSHACKALARLGYRPIVYDNLSCGNRWAVKWGPLELGDLCDRGRLAEVLRAYDPVAVMHFAAHAYVGESVENPAKYYRNNVVGTLTLLEEMRERKIDKIVFSSTCAVYGDSGVVPIAEDHDLKPVNPYGASKLMAERILIDFYNAYKIRSISLRYFNAAGADVDLEIGEAHYPETHLIPLILEVAAGVRPAIKIFGCDYDTADKTCIRDYIHVSDIAAAHLLALDALMSGREVGTYNLSNGRGYSVREVISAVEAIIGQKIPVELLNRRVGDPPVLIGDSKLIGVQLGWYPKFPDLEFIIQTAWCWYKKHSNTKKAACDR